MAPTARSRASRRASTATSNTPYTPDPHPPPPTRRSGVSTRGVRVANTNANDDSFNSLPTPSPASTRVPAHYTLPPTVPSSFAGTLDASLDAILEFGTEHALKNAGIQAVVDTLLREVDNGTDWPKLLRAVLLGHGGRKMLEEILFLVTRTLLPEQIAENSDAMAKMYERKKSLAIRMVLRYDMLREWKGEGVASLPPPIPPTAHTNGTTHVIGNEIANGHTNGNGTANGHTNGDVDMSDADTTPSLPSNGNIWKRRELMPNILPTLIAAPSPGFSTHGVRERMKHHPTALDTYLLLSDAAVSKWSDQTLLAMASQIVLQWQWLRQNNEMLEEMEVYGYEELEGKADECEWVVDGGRSRRSAVGTGGDNGSD